jgi:hypothetical protein
MGSMLGRRRRQPDETQEPESPGWNAITAALESVYGDQPPKHVGYTPGLHFGSGLQGCSAHWAADHWHYVTYGLTELWTKTDDADRGISGWGYELTLRVRGIPDEPPPWPFNLLETIARHTRDQQHPFLVGDRLDPGGPITGAEDTRLRAIAFTLDPVLRSVDSPNGRFEFRQLVGITSEELETMRAGSTDDVLSRLASGNPLLVTDPTR